MINAVGREGLRLAERWFAKTIEVQQQNVVLQWVEFESWKWFKMV